MELSTADRDIPLWKLLRVPEARLNDLAAYPVEILDPSVRLSNRLKVFGAGRIDQLLRASLGELHAVHGVGVHVLQEVLDGLGEFLDAPPTPPDGKPATGTRQVKAPPPPPVDDRPLQDPVETLGFSAGTLATLHYARIRTLDRLVAALWRIDPVLYLNVPAYCEAYEVLKARDFRDGDALAARRALVGERWAPDLDVVVELCGHLCTEREWEILEGRFGLYPAGAAEGASRPPATPRASRPIARRTLQGLSDELGVTRERVRQIEAAALKRVLVRGGPLASLGSTLAWLMERAGGVLSLRASVEELTPYVAPGKVSPEAILHFVYETSKDFIEIEPGSIYGLPSAPASEYHRVISLARRLCFSSAEDVRGDRLAERICADLEAGGDRPDPAFVRAALRADGRFLDAGSPSRRPIRGLINLVAAVLREIGRPAHFTHVAAELNARGWRGPVTPHSVHSRLSSHRDLFTWVAPGTYGLVEWGQADQRPWKRSGVRIGDLCEEFLREIRRPASPQEIVAYVLARKECRAASIRAALELDERFEWIRAQGYGLAEWLRR